MKQWIAQEIAKKVEGLGAECSQKTVDQRAEQEEIVKENQRLK